MQYLLELINYLGSWFKRILYIKNEKKNKYKIQVIKFTLIYRWVKVFSIDEFKLLVVKDCFQYLY